jgi:hypothetical protein
MSDSKHPQERRTGQLPIPDDIKSRLSMWQQQTLARLTSFGWSIQFVRRPLFQDQVVILTDPSGSEHAILNEDGSIDRKIDFEIR